MAFGLHDKTRAMSTLGGKRAADSHSWKGRNGRAVLEDRLNLQVPECVNICPKALQFKGDWGKDYLSPGAKPGSSAISTRKTGS